MSITKRIMTLGGLFYLGTSMCLFGTHPVEVVFSSYAEFLKGEFRGVSLTSDGKLVLAPALVQKANTGEAFVYSAVQDGMGGLFFGTGNNGKIFRFSDSSGAEEWAKLEEAGVYALAVDASNRIYAGTGPDGKVYRFDRDGKAEIFFDPSDKYIWDLAVDSQNNLYVATGPRGVIYKVDSQGEGNSFFDSEDTHIVELEWDFDNNLLAGSASEGLLYRISSAGKASVLYDSALEEVKAITVDRYGNVFGAILSGKGNSAASPTTPTPAKNVEGSSNQESIVAVPGTAKGSRLEVCRIDREDLVETIYSSSDEIAFDLVVRSDGRLLIATGNKGRVLSIDSKRFLTLVAESGEEQVTKFVDSPRGFYLATSNLGKVFKMEPQPPETGVFEAKVLDAGGQANWGSIRWSVLNGSGDGVKLYSRSGNREDPDATWTDWEGPYESSEGSQIRSPSARYLQWKVEFAPEMRSKALLSEQDAVDLVSVSFMQRNIAPKVTSVVVHPPGVAFLRPPEVNPAGGIPPGGPDGAHADSLPRSIRQLGGSRAASPPRKIFVPGARSFSWKASDPNDDTLVFSLHLRVQGKTGWVEVAKDLSETQYTLDGASYADGVYFLRVVASDRSSNPLSQAQGDELVSKAFTIANSIPTITWETPGIAKQTVDLGFTASTNASAIYQVEYSVEGQGWLIVYPEDGIPDEKQERFNIHLENLGKGSHRVRVRVVDTVGNLGTHSTSFNIQ